MTDITFDELETAIATPSRAPREGGRLKIAARPEPFVAPTVRLVSPRSASPLSVEVVLVQASAAVGKSIMAACLSSSRRLPLLNLAEVPVSTDSLVGLVQSDLSSPGDPIEAFHAGTLPLIIDALDEGRLLSGERGFEGFLITTGELLLRDRSVTNRPKLIIFGRHESTDLARVGLEIAGDDIRICSVEVGFFDENAARDLIDAYARASAKSDAAYVQHPEPVHELIGAYFRAIEAALGLERGALWGDERGRAFAGYAPVLAALGSLLAELDNFGVVANRLNSGGSQEAWGVIETVLNEILDREQGKLGNKLAQHLAVPLPAEVYDAEEQLTFLTRLIHNQTLEGSTRVRLPGPDQEKYFTMVRQSLPEHPFVRQGELRNAVLGSLVLAHAVNHDLLKDTDLRQLEDLSRQPFVWRSLRHQLASPGSLLDGRYLGCILNSFWSDPLTRDSRVIIRSASDDTSANVLIPGGSENEIAFEIALPVTLYAQVRDCDIDLSHTVVLTGHALRDSASIFSVHGRTTIVCDALEVAADTMTLDGTIWFEAEQITAPPRLDLRPKKGAQVGWKGQFTDQYPWNRFPTTLSPPYAVPGEDALSDLVDECRARLPGHGGVLTLNTDFSVPDDDRRVRWIARRFPDDFPRLIKLMVQHSLASTDTMDASGNRPKTRVRFSVTWNDLRDALRDPTSGRDLQEFIREARRAFSG